jgi:hypothetical protein
MESTGDPRNTLLRIVRGDLHCAALSDLDIKITITYRAGARSVDVENPRSLLVRVNPVDIAMGILKYYPDRKALLDWATVVYLTDLLDYERVDEFENGQLLLDALFDASFGVPISDATVMLARQLANQ